VEICTWAHILLTLHFVPKTGYDNISIDAMRHG
jgi:hypothetical protein